MKKLVTFRFDPELLERIRRSAQAENRTLTNFVETVLKQSVDGVSHGPLTASDPQGGDAQHPRLER